MDASQKLIEEIEEDERKEYAISEKGRNVLRYFDEMMNLMKIEYETTEDEAAGSL